jgi:hypothetical protein
MRGCVTCGRLAGASGRAGCGVLPGSSIRRRIVGGTNRPVADGGATGAAATVAGASSIGSSTTGGSSNGGASGTITIGGASSTSTGGGGSTSTMGDGATKATGASTGSSTTGCAGAGVGGATTGTAVTSAGAYGLTVLTRRGGPSTGAAGLGGSAFFSAGAFFAAVLVGAACSANMSPPGREMLRCRARRSTNERATTSSIVLEALFSSIP